MMEKAASDCEKAEFENTEDISLEDRDHALLQDDQLRRKLLYKMDIRIVPLTAFIYLLCNLDRSNIGNAKIMNEEEGDDLLQQVHLTDMQYIIALMMFLVAYALFEVPSNILLKRFRPSPWISFLMFSWGAITMGIGGVHNFASLTVVRFLLGVFEAGLFPGLVYYLTFWYTAEERSIRVALIFASATLAGAFGGSIAYGISFMEGVHGLNAWRWLFILEGLPSALLAIPIFFLLPDYPETARWLSEEEKSLAIARVKVGGSKATGKGLDWQAVKETLTDWRLWVHFVVYFGVSVPFSSLSLFSPTIVAGLGYTSIRAQLFTVPPWAVAYVVTVSVAYAADKLNRRGLFAAGSAAVGAVGFITSACLRADDYKGRYGALIIAASGSFASVPPLLGWLSSNMRTTSTTGLAIALNVSFGAPGQISGLWIYKSDEATKGYPTGHWTNAALLIMDMVLCVGLHLMYVRRNRRLREGEEKWKL